MPVVVTTRALVVAFSPCRLPASPLIFVAVATRARVILWACSLAKALVLSPPHFQALVPSTSSNFPWSIWFPTKLKFTFFPWLFTSKLYNSRNCYQPSVAYSLSQCIMWHDLGVVGEEVLRGEGWRRRCLAMHSQFRLKATNLVAFL